MSALEKLAALRAGKTLTPTQKVAVLRGAPVPTHLLDQMGVTGAEIKRRAAAGEPAIQDGTNLRAGTRGENMAALGIDAMTGAAEGLGTMVGLATDVATDAMTAGPTRRVLGRVIHGQLPRLTDFQTPMPVTQTATRAADDFRDTARRVTGLSDVDTGAAGAGVRFVANLVTPVPEVVAASRVAGAVPQAERAIAGAAEDVAPAAERALANVADAADTPASAAVRIAPEAPPVRPPATEPPARPVELDEIEADIDQLEKRAGDLFAEADDARAAGQHDVARKAEETARQFGDYLTSMYERRDALMAESASPKSGELLDADIHDIRVAATAKYRKYISKIDEMDVDPGQRYLIDEFFDKDSHSDKIYKGMEVYDAFEPYRAALRAKYGKTVRLVRYDAPKELHLPNKTVLHWSDPAEADALAGAHSEGGKRVRLERDIPIDDIVAAPSGGLGKQQEFLVLNHESPNTLAPYIGEGGAVDDAPIPPFRGGGDGGSGGGTPPPSAPPPAPEPAPPVPPAGGDGELGKYARPSAINLDRLAITDEAKRFVDTTAKSDGVAQVLTDLKGGALTHDEIKAAQSRAALLTDPVARRATENYTASLLASRNELARMAQTGVVTKEYLALQNAVSTNATDLGRSLGSLAINAGDGEAAKAMADITKQLAETGKTADEIVEALKDTNFADPASAAAAYKVHVKPNLTDWLEAYRHTNLLSSPRTHLTNATSNLVQIALVRPADIMASGAYDRISSLFTGKARTRYAREVGPYYRGMFASTGKAWTALHETLAGRMAVTQPELARVARQEGLPLPLKVVGRLLDGVDKFTMTLLEGGEMEALAARARKQGTQFNEVEAAKEARRIAKDYAFRGDLDPTNGAARHGLPAKDRQGALLSKIDDYTERIMHALDTPVTMNVGGKEVRTAPGRWFVPYIRTPMGVFKEGLAHTPFGFATLYHSDRKAEQIGKAVTGSVVMMGAGILALNGRTTWAAPRDAKAKAAFYAAGYQPYSIKIGDEWVSYTKLGPLGYPIALAAGMRYESEDNPEATHQLDLATTTRVFAALAKFFSDQSYMQGIGDLVNATDDESKIARVGSNTASQLVPLSSLQRWVAHIIDPVYRKAGRKATVDDILQNLKRDMPWLSETVEPQLTPDGKPSLRQMPVVNAISPVSVTTENPAGVKKYENLLAKRAQARKLKAAREAQNGGG